MLIYKAILDTLVCLSALATGVSAIVAVVHYLRHWRDDAVKLSVFCNVDESKVTGNPEKPWFGELRITNVGKVPVTMTALEIAEKDVAEKFTLLYGSSYLQKRLDQGAAIECTTILSAKDRGVTLPERFTIVAKWATAMEYNGKVVIEPAKAGAARQE